MGGIAQKFSTNPGQQYVVTFALAGHDSGLLQELGVGAAGQSAEFFFQAGTDPTNLGWETKSWLFTAVDTETTLEFYSLQTSYKFGGPALDNVSVVAVSEPASTVPEPSSLASLLVFGSLASCLRLKRKKTDLI